MHDQRNIWNLPSYLLVLVIFEGVAANLECFSKFGGVAVIMECICVNLGGPTVEKVVMSRPN